jgi:hypothetical protein
MPYTPEAEDPFGTTKTPSLSWKGLPVGSTFTLEVLAPAKILHSRDFSTGDPAFWDPVTKQSPILSAVVNVKVVAGPHSVNEERSVWAQRPSNLYAAVADAQKAAQAKLAPGGILHLRFSGEKPHENPRFNAIKEYQAKYEPPAATADVFVPTAQPSYVQPAQTTQPSGPTPGLMTPETLCQHSALPQGPRPAQPSGLCGNQAVTVLAGHRICALHKAQAEAQAASMAPRATPVPQGAGKPTW